MASETGPDLSSAVEAVEALMDDACVILRPPSRDEGVVGDDAQITWPPSATIYDQTSTGAGGRSLADADGTGGRCKASPDSEVPQAAAGTDELGGRYVVGIPIDAPAVRPYDLVRFTSSRRDPELVGRELVVLRVEAKTFAVQRALRCTVDLHLGQDAPSRGGA